MAVVEVVEQLERSDDVNEAMKVLVSKIDEAIDDMENGRVLTEEEL